MSNIKKILGFDASSTTIGWSVLEVDEEANLAKYVKSGFVKPLKKGSDIERLSSTRDAINKIILEVSPDYIGIEDIIKYMPQKSRAQTIITLAVFNRMICLLAKDFLKKDPELFNVMTIRHGLKKDKVFPSKNEIPALIENILACKLPMLYDKKGNVKEEYYDVADACAVATYYSFVLLNKTKVKKVAKPKLHKKKDKI